MLKLKILKSLNQKNDQNFSIGKKIHSRVNGRVCFIKNERILNSIKHFTLSIENEISIIDHNIEQQKFNIKIVIYGRNSCDFSVDKKYKQLVDLGFTDIYIYSGGIFEWLMLQDIYGTEEFKTTSNTLDILQYRPKGTFNILKIM